MSFYERQFLFEEDKLKLMKSVFLLRIYGLKVGWGEIMRVMSRRYKKIVSECELEPDLIFFINYHAGITRSAFHNFPEC